MEFAQNLPKKRYFWPVWHFDFCFIKDPGFRVIATYPGGNIHQLESRNSKFNPATRTSLNETSLSQLRAEHAEGTYLVACDS